MVSWKVAFLHGFIINLVTSLIGTGIVIFAGRERFAYDIPLPMLFIAAFLLTVVIEAIELKVLRLDAPFSRVILNSAVANLFSYAFVGTMIYLTLFPPVIGYEGGNGSRWRPPPVSPPIPTPSVSALAIILAAAVGFWFTTGPRGSVIREELRARIQELGEAGASAAAIPYTPTPPKS